MASDEYGEYRRGVVLEGGEIKSLPIGIDPASPLFNYGQGFFETILYERGKLYHFAEHLERIKKTCRDFKIRVDFNEVREELILDYLHKMKLENQCCRIKIIYAPFGDSGQWKTLVRAVPYNRPSKDFTLSVHNEVYDSWLNRYKSLNYHYNLYWKNYYGEKEKSDEVLFCNREGHVLEGSYTNILYRKKSTLYYVAGENHYLQGILQDNVLREVSKISGLKIESLEKGMALAQLAQADEVMICNSLMGVRNVGKIIRGEKSYRWANSADSLAPQLQGKIFYG